MDTAYRDIHERVERLTPEQAEAIRSVLRQFPEPEQPAEPTTKTKKQRRLSFGGIWHSGEPDLAERSEDIIRASFDDAA